MSSLSQLFTRSEIANMSVKNLRAMLTERGLDCSNCIEKIEYINILIDHLEFNNLLAIDIPLAVDDSLIDCSLKSCCSHCVENQSRIFALEEHVKNLEETMQKMKTVINKLVQHANTKQETSGEPKSNVPVDMAKGNMVNGQFHLGPTYSDQSGNTIYGVGNTVTGAGNQVRGKNNNISGNNNSVGGSGLNINGSGNIMNVGL